MKTGKSREGLGAITTVNGAMWMQGEHGERGRTWGNKLTHNYVSAIHLARFKCSTASAEFYLLGDSPPKFCRG